MKFILVYAAILFCLVSIKEYSKKKCLDDFLVAGRTRSGTVTAMSIAASWIWAPAIFISTKVAYEYGLSALAWFCIPNMLALVIFAPLAKKVSLIIPCGFSYIDYIKQKSGHFWQIQLGLQMLMQIVIFSIQLSMGAKLLSALENENYYLLVIVMAFAPLLYTSISGLRASIFTDSLQYILIFISVILILYFFPYARIENNSRSIEFNPFDYKLLVEFGISSALGLIVAIFADQQQWQRAFAVNNNSIIKTFNLAGCFHLFITAGLGIFGFLIYQSGYISNQNETIGADFIKQYYPAGFENIFILMALCALISTMDSSLCAFSSLWSTQIQKNKQSIRYNQKAMLLLCTIGAAISFLKLPLISLWFMASTIRLAAFAPTVASILLKNFNGTTGSISIILSLLVGVPVFAYGLIFNQASIRTLGMLLTVSVSIVVMIYSKYKSLST